MALPVSEATRATLGLLTRRQGPEDFPYSPPLARGLGMAAALTGALELALQVNPVSSTVAAAVQVLVMYGLLLFWLRQLGLANRLPQAFGALMACTVVLNLIEWPLAAILLPYLRTLRDNEAALQGATTPEEMNRILEALPLPPAVPTLALLVVLVWGVAVKTRLLERAFGIGFWRAAWRLTVLFFLASVLGSLAGSLFLRADELAAASAGKPARPKATAPAPASTPANRPAA